MVVYFCLAVNIMDEEALCWVINYFKCGIGKIILDKISIVVVQLDKLLWECLGWVQLSKCVLGVIVDFVIMIKVF